MAQIDLDGPLLADPGSDDASELSDHHAGVEPSIDPPSPLASDGACQIEGLGSRLGDNTALPKCRIVRHSEEHLKYVGDVWEALPEDIQHGARSD